MIEAAPEPKLKVIRSMIKGLNERTKQLESPEYVLAFYFNPSYRRVVVSKMYNANELRSMLLILLKRLDSKKKFVSNVLQQFELYNSANIPYNSNEQFITFWDKMPNNELKAVVRKLMAIIPNSAKCKRLFSTMSYIKKKWQGQMAKTTLSAYALIKIGNLGVKEQSTKETVLEDGDPDHILCVNDIINGDMTEDELFNALIEDQSAEFLSDDFSITNLFDVYEKRFVCAQPQENCLGGDGSYDDWNADEFL